MTGLGDLDPFGVVVCSTGLISLISLDFLTLKAVAIR
jgi:hypothetical protein